MYRGGAGGENGEILLFPNDSGEVGTAQVVYAGDFELIWFEEVEMNGDNFPELIVVGEWIPIIVLENNQGTLSNQTAKYNLRYRKSLWHHPL